MNAGQHGANGSGARVFEMRFGLIRIAIGAGLAGAILAIAAGLVIALDTHHESVAIAIALAGLASVALLVAGLIASRRAAERARDEFFALASHEMRAPLTSIVGYAELLSEDLEGSSPLTDEERSRFLEIVNRSSRRLLRLVGDLLFVARVESGGLEMEDEAFDLARPVQESLEAARPRAAAASLTLAGTVEGPLRVRGDEGRIGQALDNLIANAIKFTPEGGSVTVRAAGSRHGAVVEVRDTGVGIPPEDRDRIYDRFFRGSRGDSVEGVGLGLVITRAIIEGHGGHVEVESEAGRGSTFRVVLPAPE